MQEKTLNIDAIVAEVVRRLRREITIIETNTNEYRVEEKLITLETMKGLSFDQKKWIVPQRAVITPAARDELRQKGILLERCSGRDTKSKHRIWIGFDNETTIPQALVTAAEVLESRVCRGSLDELIEQRIESNGPAIILTNQPAKGACLANRNKNLRAATVSHLAEANEAITSMEANLFVVHMKKMGAYQLRQMIDLINKH